MIKTLWDGSKEVTYSELQDLKDGICPICDYPNMDTDEPKIKRRGHYTYYCNSCDTYFTYKGG